MKTRVFLIGPALITLLPVLSPGQAFGGITWKPTAGGAYEWTDTANWNGGFPGANASVDMRTKAQSGDQTIHLATPLQLNQFYPGANDDTPYGQTFTGESVVVVGNFRVMGGHMTVMNTITSKAGDNYIGYLKDSTLTVGDGGQLVFEGTGGPRVGGRAAPGTVFVKDGGTLVFSTNNISLWLGTKGNGGETPYPGCFWQDGGRVDFVSSAGEFFVGPFSDGYCRIKGGTFNVSSINYAVKVGGCPGSYSLLHLSGGTLSGGRTDNAPSFSIGNNGGGAASTSEVYLSGGTITLNGHIALGNWTGTSAGPRTAILTVDGDAKLNAQRCVVGVTVAANGENDRNILNLNGGLLSLSSYLMRYGNVPARAEINLNGGTVEFRVGSSISQLSDITLYSKGGTIDTGIYTLSFSSPFRAAKGYGVGAITLSNPGSGYVTAPQVKITGGAGSNATAVCVMNVDRTIERVVVTCPGEGYLANDTLAVEFTSPSGYGSGAAANVSLAENTLPTLTKIGEGGTVQYKTVSPFDGILAIKSGYINLEENGVFSSLPALHLIGGIFTLNPSVLTNSLNPSVALCFKPASTQSSFRTRASTNEENEVFSQRVALLSVDHALGVIEKVYSYGKTHLTVDRFTCEGGLMRFTPSDSSSLALESTEYLSPSTVSPVVNGFITYDGTNLLERDSVTHQLALAPTTATPGPDANVIVGITTNSCDGEKVNSVIFENFPETAPKVESRFQFENTEGASMISSGMVLSRRRAPALVRLSTKSGGSLTTTAKGGMIVFEACTYPRGGNKTDNGRRFLLSSTFADPDNGEPMALTIAGYRCNTPGLGAWAWLMQENTFSGGLNLVNACALQYRENDLIWGAAGAPITASGYSALAQQNENLVIAANRPIVIRENSCLQLLTTKDKIAYLNGPVSGEGDLLAGDPGFVSCTVLRGNNNGHKGCLYIIGRVQAEEGVGLSTNASLRFAESASSVASALELSGRFERVPGAGANQICWKRHASGIGGTSGGFSAIGEGLVVNLGGDARALVWGSDILPVASRITLQGSTSTAALRFENTLDINGYTGLVYTASSKKVTLGGRLIDSRGGGMLSLSGGGTIQLAGENVLDFPVTGAGNLEIASALSGTGTVALAGGTLTVENGGVLSPGSANAIGTFTVGSEDVPSTAVFENGTLAVSFDANASDRLVVNGNLEIRDGSCVRLDGIDPMALAALRRSSPVIASWTGTRTGDFARTTNVRGWRVKADDGSRTLSLYYAESGSAVLLK